MLTATRLALADIVSPPLRAVLWKSLGLTIAALICLWLAVQGLLAHAIDIGSYPWIETVIAVVAGVGLLIGLAFLVAPVTAILAGLFTDEIAAAVEQVHYPHDPPGRDIPVHRALADALAFAVVVIAVNLVALALLLVPGVNLVAFLLGNGYLLGREYFEAAARRFTDREGARRLRRAHGGTVFAGGLMIALFLAVPLVNLLAPLFATALMVHLHKRLAAAAA